MPSYPLTFSSSTHSGPDFSKPWSGTADSRNIELAIPPEFGGAGGGLSPEDLFNLALSNCFVATFKVIAQNSKLTYSSIDVQSKLTVDKNESGQPVMKHIDVAVNIQGASSPQRALSIAQKVANSGFILNSVYTTRNFEFNVA